MCPTRNFFEASQYVFTVNRTYWNVFFIAKSTSSSTGYSSGHVDHRKWVFWSHVARDQHDVQELLVAPAVDQNVDWGVDHQSEMVDVDLSLKYIWNTFVTLYVLPTSKNRSFRDNQNCTCFLLLSFKCQLFEGKYKWIQSNNTYTLKK